VQPRRCERCGTEKRLLKPKDGLPTTCFVCWQAGNKPMRVVVLPPQPTPEPSRRITSKRERRTIGILKTASGGGDYLSERQMKARRRRERH
jgi:hypothetical protein